MKQPLKGITKVVVLAIVLTVAATSAFAGTQGSNTNTLSTTLNISATVQSAVRLTLLVGTSTLAAHCTPTPAGGTPDYTMNFGTVDALAISTPTCGVSLAPVTPGTTPAIYFTDYTIKPIFTGQSAASNPSITEQVTSNFGVSSLTVVTGGNTSTVPTVPGNFTAVPTASAAALADSSNIVSGTGLTRFVGVSVAPTNGAGTFGASSATVTYTLTVI